MDALAVVMQDLLTENQALRRENDELLDQVRRLLCEKANLLAQQRSHWPGGNLIEMERATQDHAPATWQL